MQPWPGLLRIKVMLCMAWTGLALTYRYEHVTVQRIQRGRDKEKNHEWACYMHCNRACGCCNLVRRIFPSWRQVPPSDKDKARIKGKGKGHRNRLIGRETSMWKKEKGHCRLRLDQYPLSDMAAAATARASLKRGPLKPKSL
ncbi:hypothetical protein J3E68DRAFT_414043 [Trichoderma sp. SZMC 28012]